MTAPFGIIFLEGNPFTGKSTTSEYVADQLRRQGIAAVWISEGALFQRFFPQTLVMADQEQPFSLAIWQREWEAFAGAVAAEEAVWVVDSALSYVGVLPLQTENWPADAIAAEMTQIAARCAPLRPRVIHLVGDAAQLIPASIVDRGADWEEQLIRQSDAAPYQKARGRTGLAGAIAMLQEGQDLTAAALARDGWPLLTIDVMAADWPARRQAIMAFLGLTEITVERPVLPLALLESYVGTYAALDPARADRPLVVQLEGDALVLGSLRQRYGPLVPVSDTRFHLQASPLDIAFTMTPGHPAQLALLRAEASPEVYHRI